MKKIGTICISLFCITVLMSSCEKEFSCTCTATIEGQNPTYTQALIEGTRKDATSKCRALSVRDSSVLVDCIIE